MGTRAADPSSRGACKYQRTAAQGISPSLARAPTAVTSDFLSTPAPSSMALLGRPAALRPVLGSGPLYVGPGHAPRVLLPLPFADALHHMPRFAQLSRCRLPCSLLPRYTIPTSSGLGRLLSRLGAWVPPRMSQQPCPTLESNLVARHAQPDASADHAC